MPGSPHTRPRFAERKTSRIAAARLAPDEFPWARRPGSTSSASWKVRRKTTPAPRAGLVSPVGGKARSRELSPTSSCGLRFYVFRRPSMQGSAFRGIFAAMFWLMQMHGVVLRVVSEKLRVAAPVQRGFNLLFDFHLCEAFVQQVPEKFHRHRVIRFLFQRGSNLLQQGNMR